MACLLRIAGKDLALDACLDMLEATPERIWRKGEPRSLRRAAAKNATSGFSIRAGGGDDISVQVSEATIFLERNGGNLRDMTSRSDVGHASLDFAWDFPAGKEGLAAQFNRFPHELLRLCGELELAIEVSVYMVSDDGNEIMSP